MLSSEKLAIRRVLTALETMLMHEGEKRLDQCATCAAQRYALPPSQRSELRGRLERARTFAETAVDTIDRALSEVESAIAFIEPRPPAGPREGESPSA